MKKEYNKNAYKVNEKEIFKMKTQELNLKQFVICLKRNFKKLVEEADGVLLLQDGLEELV
ncbi:hypothetical protein ICE98_02317 [Lactococcus lactis]|nr:hypothetical protein [Lactococcus lactis]